MVDSCQAKRGRFVAGVGWYGQSSLWNIQHNIKDYLSGNIRNNCLSLKHYFSLSGSIISRVLIDIVNSYELMSEKLRDNSPSLRKSLEEKINEKKRLLDAWQPGESNCKKLKGECEKYLESKLKESAFNRSVLRSLDLISKGDVKFLTFVWDIRNSMHRNFVAHKNIEFEFEDIKTGNKIKLAFQKDEELGVKHPKTTLIIADKVALIMMQMIKKMGKVANQLTSRSRMSAKNAVKFLWPFNSFVMYL